MKSLMVDSKKILTSYYPLNDFEKLKEYYFKIKSGNRNLMPVTLMDPRQYSIESFKADLKDNKLALKEKDLEYELINANEFECALKNRLIYGIEYLLCDGNHRAMAYTLNELDIPSRQIETFSDLKAINKEFQIINSRGPYIMRESESLQEYFFRFYRALANHHAWRTLKGNVEELIDRKELSLREGVLSYEPEDLPF